MRVERLLQVLKELSRTGHIVSPAFVCAIIGVIWSAYLGIHVVWLLQVHLPHDLRDGKAQSRGLLQFLVSQVLVGLMLTCFILALSTEPGSVPDSREWRLLERGAVFQSTREVKGTGKRRHCKWCLHFKPDRCHHCRVCNTCVLRMDHHCPWIMNCVGFRNHKYFILLVFYTLLSCIYVSATMFESVQRSSVEDMPQSHRFLLVLGLVLSLIMGALMLLFFSFHVMMMLRGMSTIEFCEKSLAKKAQGGGGGAAPSYDMGVYGNICEVLGPRPWLWLLPVSLPEGDGLHWGGEGGRGEKDCGQADGKLEWSGQSP